MAGAPYVPHILEIAVTVGFFAGGILVFGLAKMYLPLEPDDEVCQLRTASYMGGSFTYTEVTDYMESSIASMVLF